MTLESIYYDHTHTVYNQLQFRGVETCQTHDTTHSHNNHDLSMFEIQKEQHECES